MLDGSHGLFWFLHYLILSNRWEYACTPYVSHYKMLRIRTVYTPPMGGKPHQEVGWTSPLNFWMENGNGKSKEEWYRWIHFQAVYACIHCIFALNCEFRNRLWIRKKYILKRVYSTENRAICALCHVLNSQYWRFISNADIVWLSIPNTFWAIITWMDELRPF